MGQKFDPHFTPQQKSKFAIKNPQKPKFLRIFGAAGQIRTADLILTNSGFSFFLAFFDVLQVFFLRTDYFPSLFERRNSTCSTAVCGWFCGQPTIYASAACANYYLPWHRIVRVSIDNGSCPASSAPYFPNFKLASNLSPKSLLLTWT
ncbi:hypothetical protein [Intestinimonas sp.]|uniref:hypothetical protein n=1 Tax=Intestinimonas sp. TaxID=1965293 RepID=UPI002633D8C2|nr:hypothetical protein [Intestinimonas sp.]